MFGRKKNKTVGHDYGNIGFGEFCCEKCGHKYVHLGNGDFCCPKCGFEIVFDNPEGFPEEADEDFGYTYEELWGGKPDFCIGCSGAYPDCRRRCAKIKEND